MKIFLLIITSIFSTIAGAGVYKCTDDSGNTSYQAKPCSVEKKSIEMNIKTGSENDIGQQRQLQAKNLLEIEQNQQREREHQQKIAARDQLTLAEIAMTQDLIKTNPKQYSVFSIPPYYPDKLSPFVQQYADRLPEIERMRRTAAQKALASGQCRRVEADELNIKSSPEQLVFLVDCSSGKSFYFNESELTAP